jgi:hypothetical protein
LFKEQRVCRAVEDASAQHKNNDKNNVIEIVLSCFLIFTIKTTL